MASVTYNSLQQQQLAYSTKLRGYSIGVFFFLMLFNFVFYVALFSTTSLPYVFPINDILPSFYDISSISVIFIFILNCVLLLCCIFAELKLTEMAVDLKAFIHWTFFYLFLNLFYIFLTPILLLSVVRLLSNSNCFPFKCKLNEFLVGHSRAMPGSYDDNANQDSKQEDNATELASLAWQSDHSEDNDCNEQMKQLQGLQSATPHEQSRQTEMQIVLHAAEDERKQITFAAAETTEEDQDYENENERYFRSIATHHWLSRLCHRLTSQSLRNKGRKINNRVLFQQTNECLNGKLKEILQRSESELQRFSHPDTNYRIKQIYEQCVRRPGRAWSIKRKLFLRLYLLAANVSMIRLLFFNRHFQFQRDFFGFYVVFLLRMGLELVLSLALIVWMRHDPMFQQVSHNMIGTRIYFSALMSSEFVPVSKTLIEHLEIECSKYADYWKYALHGTETKFLLIPMFGMDVSCIICSYIFESQEHWFNEHGDLDIDRDLWKLITRQVFPNMNEDEED